MKNKMDTHDRNYRRQMLRSEFQSLFWHVILTRKREIGLTFKALADKLGVDKSYVSRSFDTPPNWQIDKLSDMADALDVDLHIEARDRKTGRVYTPHGNSVMAITMTIPEKSDITPQTQTKQVDGQYPLAAAS